MIVCIISYSTIIYSLSRGFRKPRNIRTRLPHPYGSLPSLISSYLSIAMDAAISYKRDHPQDSLSSVAARFQVATTTLHDHLTGTHSARGLNTPRNLSLIQEDALLDKINAYAKRGTLLTPGNITQLAKALCNHDLGRNWTTTFLRRHRDRVSSRFYRVQELARLRSDTPSNRAAFLSLVSP